MKRDMNHPAIAHGMVISDQAAVDLYVDGTLTIETMRKRELIFVKLTAAEVRELIRFFAELPALPKEQ